MADKMAKAKRQATPDNGKFNMSMLPYEFQVIDLADLKPHPEQSETREISDEAFECLKGSLAENVIEEISYNKRTGHIISGHQRCKALLALGQNNVPVKTWDVDQDTEDLMFYNLNNQFIAGRFTPLAVERISELNVRLGDRAEAVGLKLLEVSLSVPDFQSTDEDEQPRLDQKKPIQCPECGHEFVT